MPTCSMAARTFATRPYDGDRLLLLRRRGRHGLRQVHMDRVGQYRDRDHERHQQHQHHFHQRSDIDLNTPSSSSSVEKAIVCDPLG